ncbi:hypothetical protein [Nocardia sp. IFM 10818]
MTAFDVDAARERLRQREVTPERAEELLAKKHLTATEVAEIRGVSSRKVARQTLRNWGVEAIGRGAGLKGSESIYEADKVWAAILAHPLGKAWRTGKTGLLGGPRQPRKMTPEVVAKAVEIWNTSPQDLGQSFKAWTYPKLTTYLNEQGITDAGVVAVRRTVGAALEKAGATR